MAITSTGLALFSAIVGAASSVKQGQDAKKQGAAEAGIARDQAANAREVAAATERDFRRSQSAALGELLAARGTSGTESGTGSSLIAGQDFQTEIEIQAQRIRKGGQTQSTRLEQQADLYNKAGRSAQQRGYTRAGASLLSGASDWYGSQKKPAKKEPISIQSQHSDW